MVETKSSVTEDCIDDDELLVGLGFFLSHSQQDGIGEEDVMDAETSAKPHPVQTVVGIFLEKIEFIILAMIVINSIMMGISTYDVISENDALKTAFETTDKVFLIIFTVELVLNLFHLGMKSINDRWFMFDLIIIVLSWSPLDGPLQAIRAFRTLRLVSRIEMFKDVIEKIGCVVPKMGSVGLLLAFILFIFSILFTELFG